MTEPISTEELQWLTSGYVLYDLSLEEADTLEQLMASNPAIAQEIDRTQQALELAYACPEMQPPASLRASILNAYDAERNTTPQAEFSSTVVPFSQRRGWLAGLGAVAAMLIVGLSISNLVLWRSLQVLQAQQSTDDVLTVSLKPDDIGNAASVEVMIDPTDLQATLNVENLPPLPEGQVYVLWTVVQPDAPFTVDDKDAILTQVFTVDDQGKTVEQMPLPRVYHHRQWLKAIAITIESADAPQRHESSPILIEML